VDLEQMEKYSKDIGIKYGYIKKLCEHRKKDIEELEKKLQTN
jgi:hypothetical protein